MKPATHELAALVLVAALTLVMLSASPAWAKSMPLLKCGRDSNHPALLGWCYDGTMVAPVHLTGFQVIKRRFIGLAEVGGFVASENTYSVAQLGAVLANGRFFGGIQVGGYLLTSSFYGLAQIGGWVGSAKFFMSRVRARRFRGVVQVILGLAKVDDFIGLIQFAPVTRVKSFIGLAQVGIYNHTDELTGLQIGLVNRVRRLRGIQIGLVNIVEDSPLRVMPIINAYWY